MKQKTFSIQKKITLLLVVLALCLLLVPQKSKAAAKYISKCTIGLPYTSVEYTGNYIKPQPLVEDGGKELILNTDYTLSYSQNRSVGKAYVTITGKGNYKGKVVRSFGIIKKPISKCKITLTPSFFVYDGKEKVPTIKVSNGSVAMTLNVSYDVKITDNTKVGMASVLVTGKGNYTGSSTVTFPIGPDKVTIKSSSVNYSSFTMSWNTVANIDGYYLYQYNFSKKQYTKIGSIAKSKTSYTISNLTPGTAYQYALKAYKKSASGLIITSQNYGAIKQITPMPNVNSITCTNTTSSCIYLSWPKVENVSGYMIYNYDYVRKIFVPVKKIEWNTTSCVVLDLKPSTRYSLAIKAYRNDRGNLRFSPNAVKISATTKNSYASKSLYVDGDSIAYGVGAGGYSYGDALAKTYGFQLTKVAIGGATLSNSCPACSHVVDSVVNNVKKSYDYAIIEGGVNDYLRSIEVGKIGSNDSATMAGALENIFTFFRSKYPATKLYFLIPHKIYDNGVAKRNIVDGKADNFHDITNTPNLAGYNYMAYYNTILNICTKYNVTVINAYTKSGIDATNAAQRTLYTADGDGIHPTKSVQINIYAPLAASVMGLK